MRSLQRERAVRQQPRRVPVPPCRGKRPAGAGPRPRRRPGHGALLQHMSLPPVRRQDRADRRHGSRLSTRVQYGRSQRPHLPAGRRGCPEIHPTILVTHGATLADGRPHMARVRCTDHRTDHESTQQPCIVRHHDQHQETGQRHLGAIQNRGYHS